MHPDRFDTLVRSLATPLRRRWLLAAMTLTAGEVDLEGGVVEAAPAGCKPVGAKCRKPGQCCSRKCKRRRCRCRAGAQACGGACIDLERDLANCGGCGRACVGAINCRDGECVCPSGRELCGAGCIEVQTDREHCGSCDQACDGNQDCRQGSCCDPDFHELASAERPVCCPVADICETDVCCFPGDSCVNHTCCGPQNFFVCQDGAGNCCPSSGYRCCGKTCCEEPVECCGERCCRDGTICCPDDPERCCSVEDVCEDETCHCYADRFLFDGKCYARAGSGGGGFRRARGVL